MEMIALVIGGVVAQLCMNYLEQQDPAFLAQRAWADWLAWAVIAGFSLFQSSKSSYQSIPSTEKESTASTRRSRIQLNSTTIVLAMLLVSAQTLELRAPSMQLHWSFPTISLFTFLIARHMRQNHTRSISLNNTPPKRLATCQNFVAPFLDVGVTDVLVLGTTVISCFAFQSESSNLSKLTLAIGIMFTIATTTAYVMIDRISLSTQQKSSSAEQSCVLDGILPSTSAIAFVLYSIYLVLCRPAVWTFSLTLLGLTVSRLVQTAAILLLCFRGTAVVASSLAIISAASINVLYPLTVSSSYASLILVVTGLTQSYFLMPRSTAFRPWIFILLTIPCSAVLLGWFSFGTKATFELNIGHVHPIRRLAEAGDQEMSNLLARQSRTVDEGVVEYQRRYGRSPPPGYEKWFEIAQQHEFQLIDEFDAITNSLEPFWNIPPSVLRQRLDSIKTASQIIELNVQEEEFEQSEEHFLVDSIAEWLNFTRWAGVIPDVRFMINVFDEPRVAAPYHAVNLILNRNKTHHSSKPQLSALGGSASRTAHVYWMDAAKQDAWEAILLSCPVGSPARVGVRRPATKPQSIHFLDDVTLDRDICASTNQLYGHGFLQSPESLTITQSLVPIFSQCRPSSFNDVLYPSPFYLTQMHLDNHETNDTAFDDKLDSVYWAGSATGGRATMQNWKTLHRQRLTLMTHPDSTEPVSLLQRDHSTGIWQQINSNWRTIVDLFHVRITRTVQCSVMACTAMEKAFDAHGVTEAPEAPMSHKYVLDMDGNSFSGRFYRLLKSNACVIKQTIFQEWHDGRLLPWVHFIPLSVGAEELGEMARYLTQEDEGRIIGERIASQGRDWAQSTLREIDLEIVFIRVMMEYARIMDDKRDDLFYRGGN